MASAWTGPVTGTGRFALAAGLPVVLAAFAAALVAGGREGPVPFVAWILALAVVAVSALRRLRLRVTGVDAAIGLGLLALSAGFRIVHATTIPAGLWVDELSTAINALRVWAGGFAPFGTTPLMPDGSTWVHTSNLYLYAVAPLIHAAGRGVSSVKAISVVPGILAPLFCYALARRWAGRAAATLAGGLLAASLWHVAVSRWGWDEVLVTTLAVAGFLALSAALERDEAGAGALAGIVFGLALYAYVGSRLAAAAAVLALIFHALRSRSRASLQPLGGFALGSIVSAAPLVAIWITHPTVFSVRTSQLSIVGRVLHGDLNVLLTNLVAYLGMFSIHGDPNPRHNLPGMPMLGIAWGVLFLVGLVLAHAGWRRERSRLLLCWFWVGLAGGVLSDPSSAPNSYRVGLVAPACALFAALAFETLTARWAGRPRLRAALVAALVAVTGARTVSAYFVARPADLACWWANKDGAATELVVAEVRAQAARGAPCLVDDSLLWTTMRLRLQLARVQGESPLAALDVASTTRDGLPDLAGGELLIAPDRWRALAGNTAGFVVRSLTNPFGQTVALAVTSPAPAVGTADAPQPLRSSPGQSVEDDPGHGMQ